MKKKPYVIILKNGGNTMTTTIHARSMLGAKLIAGITFLDLGFQYRHIIGVVDNNI